MFIIFGSVVIGGIIGYAAEQMRLTRLGYVVAVAVGVGGAILFSLSQYMLGLGFGLSRGMTSIVGAIALLFIANMRR